MRTSIDSIHTVSSSQSAGNEELDLQKLEANLINLEKQGEYLQRVLESCSEKFDYAKTEKLSSSKCLIEAELKQSKEIKFIQDKSTESERLDVYAVAASRKHMELLESLGKLEIDYKSKHASAMESDRIADIARQRCRRSKEQHEVARVSAATKSRAVALLAEPVQAQTHHHQQLCSDASKWESQALEIRSRLSCLVDEEFEAHEQYKQLGNLVPQLAMQKDQV